MSIFADEKSDFAVKVSSGVEWVPLHSAGKPQYTDTQLSSIKCLTPEQKKKNVHTIFDAINLLVACEFYEKLDTFRILASEGGEWEYHKSGYEAIADNCGCCASCASGLLYLLDGEFDKSGYICFIRPDSSGHVLTFFKKEEYYYIIDPSTYMKNYIAYTVQETGHMSDFIKRKYFTNGLFRTNKIDLYLLYIKRYLLWNNITFIFYYCDKKGDYCIPVKHILKQDFCLLTLPKNWGITVYKDNSKFYKVEYIDLPFSLK